MLNKLNLGEIGIKHILVSLGNSSFGIGSMYDLSIILQDPIFRSTRFSVTGNIDLNIRRRLVGAKNRKF